MGLASSLTNGMNQRYVTKGLIGSSLDFSSCVSTVSTSSKTHLPNNPELPQLAPPHPPHPSVSGSRLSARKGLSATAAGGCCCLQLPHCAAARQAAETNQPVASGCRLRRAPILQQCQQQLKQQLSTPTLHPVKV